MSVSIFILVNAEELIDFKKKYKIVQRSPFLDPLEKVNGLEIK